MKRQKLSPRSSPEKGKPSRRQPSRFRLAASKKVLVRVPNRVRFPLPSPEGLPHFASNIQQPPLTAGVQGTCKDQFGGSGASDLQRPLGTEDVGMAGGELTQEQRAEDDDQGGRYHGDGEHEDVGMAGGELTLEQHAEDDDQGGRYHGDGEQMQEPSNDQFGDVGEVVRGQAGDRDDEGDDGDDEMEVDDYDEETGHVHDGDEAQDQDHERQDVNRNASRNYAITSPLSNVLHSETYKTLKKYPVRRG